ncbi:MAG TPA: DUF1232 domain-containing protein [Chloroflexi bacterium]|jgi:uncharacterized membrane protein YkvA (DUF1232 family)|nr:DUF1232 domain-containing protein [Chloroflexota bacterium]
MDVDLERALPQIVYPDEAQTERFYTRLRRQTCAWLRHRNIRGALQEYLLLLPDLFVLLTRLIRDPRIDVSLRVQLSLAGAYVLSPVDLIPDFVMPVGLADDVTALAFILNRVVTIMGQAGEDILYEHWDGRGDVLKHVQGVLRSASTVLNARVVARLRKMFGHAPKAALR